MKSKQANRKTEQLEPKQSGLSEIGTKIILIVVIALYLALAFTYSAVTPAATADQHNADENAHMIYVQTVSSGHLPVFKLGAHNYEAHQPPLYYLLAAPADLVSEKFGLATATRVTRCVSILLGALLIVVSFLCVRAVLPDEPLVAVGTAMFIGLLPANIALSASVTNDPLNTLVITLCMWKLAKLANSAKDETPGNKRSLFKKSALVGLILGIGIWTKTLTLPLFPVVIIVFLLLAYRKKIAEASAVMGVLISLGVGLLIGTPWLIRNSMLYGDPLAQKLLTSTLNDSRYNTPAEVMIYIFGGYWNYLAKVFQWSFESYWGGFDSMRLFWGMDPLRAHPNFLDGPGPIYGTLIVLSLLSALGLIRFVQSKALGNETILISACAALICFTGIAFLHYNLGFFQAQGRYWYPALFPLSFFFMLGWRGFVRGTRVYGFLITVIAIGLIALNLYTVFGLLVPRFAGS
jgi:hypothetical protein